MPSKTFKVWLLLDWRTEKVKVRKTKPSATELGKNELISKVTVEVNIPEVETPELALAIDVPEPQVRQAVIESLSEDELPSWTEVVPEVVERFSEPEKNVDAITAQVLYRVETRPDPVQVSDYVEQFVRGDGDSEDA